MKDLRSRIVESLQLVVSYGSQRFLIPPFVVPENLDRRDLARSLIEVSNQMSKVVCFDVDVVC